MRTSSSPEAILKEASEITGATWAVCVERRDSGWRLKTAHRLNKTRQSLFLDYLAKSSTDAWLCGAIAGGRTRSRKLSASLNIGCSRLFIFPVKGTQALILVGADALDKKAQRVWRLVAMSGALCSNEMMLHPADAFLFGGQSTVPYDLPRSLERVLARIVQYVPCQAGWLAIYEENALRVEAQWNCPEALGNKIVVETSEIFRRVKRTAKGKLVERGDPEWDILPQQNLLEDARAWTGIPLLIGRRLIGMVVLWREEAFRLEEWQQLQSLAVYATPSVEMFVTFAEIADHLRRLAMLNDFALIVSSAQNLDQIVRRVFALLARTFGTELISLFLLSSDGRTLREYRNQGRKVSSRTLFVENHPLAHFVRDGQNVRVENAQTQDFIPIDKDAQAALIVPLKYRGKVIGVLELESEQVSAFSMYDENLLVVIASHLAGLVEYGRLREEAEARARNLGLIHEVIQQVIGLTNAAEVAQITADLLVQHFAYELAVVLFVDRERNLSVEGISGSATSIVKAALDALEYPVAEGITGHVFSTGKSMLVNDVSQAPVYKYIPGWEIGSEMCVALRDGERILGIIDVESSSKNAFMHNDLLALESLAGFLTSVVSSVDRYQMLQDTVQMLRKTQDELQARIEAQRAAENQLLQAAKLAAVGEMAAGIAHELNNPLTTVAGFSELVLDELSEDAPHRADMELVLREARRARSVVRRLLDFARQGESVRVRADLNEVVEDVAALTKHLFRINGVQLHMQLADALPWIPMDRNQIKQVVLNLLHNALHAMPAGGELSVKTEKRKHDDQQWLTMAVRDTGMGISPDNLGRIFEPFFTTKADRGGTGLGLSVTYGIVTDHGGFIDVESDPDDGSCFTVWLPAEDRS
ncbi:MAG: GAF domain-containing protein [Chloroflexi bacterium]|nr:GAF domain-containing protein [Chloroflexota bacterium]